MLATRKYKMSNEIFRHASDYSLRLKDLSTWIFKRITELGDYRGDTFFYIYHFVALYIIINSLISFF